MFIYLFILDPLHSFDVWFRTRSIYIPVRYGIYGLPHDVVFIAELSLLPMLKLLRHINCVFLLG